MNDNKEWYLYYDENTSYGPYSYNDIINFYQDGTVFAESYFFKEGFSDWKQLKDIDVFKELFFERKTYKEQNYCVNHSDVVALKKCFKCKQYFCQDCLTLNSGNNFCSSCLVEYKKNSEHYEEYKKKEFKVKDNKFYAFIFSKYFVVLVIIFLYLFYLNYPKFSSKKTQDIAAADYYERIKNSFFLNTYDNKGAAYKKKLEEYLSKLNHILKRYPKSDTVYDVEREILRIKFYDFKKRKEVFQKISKLQDKYKNNKIKYVKLVLFECELYLSLIKYNFMVQRGTGKSVKFYGSYKFDDTIIEDKLIGIIEDYPDLCEIVESEEIQGLKSLVAKTKITKKYKYKINYTIQAQELLNRYYNKTNQLSSIKHINESYYMKIK